MTVRVVYPWPYANSGMTKVGPTKIESHKHVRVSPHFERKPNRDTDHDPALHLLAIHKSHRNLMECIFGQSSSREK